VTAGWWKSTRKKKDPLYYRLLRAFMRGSFEGSLNAPRLKIADTDCIRQVAETVVKRAAKGGRCVIVGRGSAYYLKDDPDAFHAFVYAPFEEKVRRLMAEGKGDKEAAQLVESVDHDRAAFIKRYFHVEWPERQRFHLMINSTIGVDGAVETILNGIALFEKERGEATAPAQRESAR
jgi:cytidylate kinase